MRYPENGRVPSRCQRLRPRPIPRGHTRAGCRWRAACSLRNIALHHRAQIRQGAVLRVRRSAVTAPQQRTCMTAQNLGVHGGGALQQHGGKSSITALAWERRHAIETLFPGKRTSTRVPSFLHVPVTSPLAPYSSLFSLLRVCPEPQKNTSWPTAKLAAIL